MKIGIDLREESNASRTVLEVDGRRESVLMVDNWLL